MKEIIFLLVLILTPFQQALAEKKPVTDSVKESQTTFVPRGQHKSLIEWKNLRTEEFLSLEQWKLERKIKDENLDWEFNYRRNKQTEPLGRILSCRGECFLYRGLDRTRVEFQSQLFEGDEIHVGEDSVAWIFFLEGSLARISSNSSVNLQEINLSTEESFVRVRLNQGHIYFSSKSSDPLEITYSPETDSHNLPLRILESNQEYFEREIFKEFSETSDLVSLFFLNEDAVKRQFEKINLMRKSFQDKYPIKAKVMVVTANGTLNFSNSSLDVAYFPGEDCYFKLREGDEIGVVLRGFKDFSPSMVSSKEWQVINSFGKEINELTQVSPVLNILQLLTKRIKSIELARELWKEKYTSPILESLESPQKLAEFHGLYSWEKKEFLKRIEFLNLEVRRLETVHLKSIQSLLELSERKKNIHNERLYHFSLDQYLLGLKKRFGIEKAQVKNMSDLQYYIWTLKNGKI